VPAMPGGDVSALGGTVRWPRRTLPPPPTAFAARFSPPWAAPGNNSDRELPSGTINALLDHHQQRESAVSFATPTHARDGLRDPGGQTFPCCCRC